MANSADNSRKQWEPMEVKDVGDVAQVIQVGGGKLTTSTNDPGEPKKVPGHDPGA